MRSALITLATAATLIGCAGTTATTNDAPHEPAVVEVEEAAPAATPPSAVSAASADLATRRFEMLKSLEGSWFRADAAGEPQLEYMLTAGGSAVVETVFPGQQMEMVSVYTLDSGRLVMTHYCAMGNQPFMVATDDGTDDVIRFECQKAGNTKSHADPHMHRGVLTIGDGTLKSEWTMYADLIAGDTFAFELVRGDS